MHNDIRPGTLLIASPMLDDSDFEESVMLVLDHDQNGTRAINLAGGNIPGPIKWGGPENPETVHYVGPFFLGGSVFQGVRDFSLSKSEDIAGVKNILAMLAGANAAGKPAYGMLLCGDANWAPGQLEKEVQGKAWLKLEKDFAAVLRMPEGERWPALYQEAATALPPEPEKEVPARPQESIKPLGKHFNL